MIYDVVIIGGGIAALTSSIYSVRKGLKTLLIAKQIGGQTNWAIGIENYPGFKKINGLDLISNTKEQSLSLGAEIIEGDEVVSVKEIEKIFEVKTNKNKYQTKTIIVASGKEPRKINIEGETEFLGKGVAYCATCDAPLFKNKHVAVIGSGNAGLDAAIELSKYCSKIDVLEESDEIKGDRKTAEKIENDKTFTILKNANITKIIGDKFVNSIEYVANKEKKQISLSGVFIEIGSIPTSNFMSSKIKKNNIGEIIVDSNTKATSIPGIFAAGDVTDNLYKQIIIAAGDGAIAAISVDEYLKKKS